jgi:hypothetical protein
VAYVGARRAALEALAEQGGGEDVLNAIIASASPDENGIIVHDTPDQIKKLITKLYDANAKTVLGPDNVNAWMSGNGRSMSPDELEDASKTAAVTVRQKALADGATEEQAQEQAILQTVAWSVESNEIPKWVRSEMSINPANREAFLNSISLFDTFEAKQPGFAAAALGDDEAIATIQRFKRLRAELADDDRAFEMLSQFDPELVKQVTPKERREAVENVFKRLDKLADKGAGFFTDAGVNDTTRNRKLVNAELDWYLSRGYSVDSAMKAAIDALNPVNGRFVQIDGHLFPRSEGWGANAQAAVDQQKEAYATENNIDVDDVEVRPIPNKPGQVAFQDRGYVLSGGMDPMDIEELNKSYAESQPQVTPEENAEVREDAAMEAQKKRRARATADAKAKLFPIHNVSARDRRNYEFAMDARERAWNKLTPEQQERLIRRAMQ